jgi:hypothetical protein
MARFSGPFSFRSTILKPFIPKRLEHIAFGLLLSGMMSLLVSGFATLIGLGFVDGILLAWMKAWLPSWALAFPVVLVVAPLVRRILGRLVIQP